jgi:hydroxymethylbilane synthase
MPAACQGALAVACRRDDKETMRAIEKIRDEASSRCSLAEQELMRAIGGNCHIPAGAYANMLEDGNMRIFACINDPNASVSYRDMVYGPAEKGLELARSLAKRIIDKGAGSILRSYL